VVVRGKRRASLNGQGQPVLLHIVARGRIGRGPEAELVERYLKRVAWPTRMTELPDTGGKIPDRAAATRLIMLDETGENLPSRVLAERLGRWRDEGVRETRFLIGAADGFDDAQRAEADLLISFGRATWPHLMARAMLAEQLWRATSILANHPYHREG
jgi:23S rRNA (pseudouridine1915-N3)-methyltransferase